MYEGGREEKLALLQKELRWAGEKSAFYKERFQAAGIVAKEIKSWDDFGGVPCLTMAEMKQADAFRLLTLPLSGILRAVCGGSETGRLKLFTRGDVMQNVEMLIGALTACGVGRGSLVGVMGDLSEGSFLDVQYALECMGVTAVPMGQEASRQCALLKAFTMDTLISTSELWTGFMKELKAEGVDIKAQPLVRLLLLSDTLPVPHMEELGEGLPMKIYSLYAPEVLGSAGMLIPCEDGTYRVAEKFFYAEVLDFGEGAPRAVKCGELVVTALRAEAMPVIRLRTGLKVRLLEKGTFPYDGVRLEILG